MTTTNCHIKFSKKGDVYCGRGKGLLRNPSRCRPNDPGYFGNPIAIGEECPICNEVHSDGGETLVCYKKYLTHRLENDWVFEKEFKKLKDKTLVCFCKPNPCHTDIMIEFLDKEEDNG